MRDLTRSNALRPAFRLLEQQGFRVYTPMRWKMIQRGRKTVREMLPVIHDLLFVKSARNDLDPVVERTSTLQYRFIRGAGYGAVMTVPDAEMERFIHATQSTDDPKFFTPEEITSAMVGKEVRIVGGPLNGYTGHLLSVKGMRKRRLLVELSGMITAAVEVNPDFVELI